VVAAGHSHSGYLDELFTTAQPLLDMWRGHHDYNGHDIVFTPTRSTGTAILDPENGPSSPSNFYRSIVGNVHLMTHQVTGVKLPPGVRGAPGVAVVPGRDGQVGPTWPRSRGGPSTSRTTLPR
jgi:hypothetical protein